MDITVPGSFDSLIAAAESALERGLFADAQLLAARARAATGSDQGRQAADALQQRVREANAAAPPTGVPEAYHRWYYDRLVWQTTTWCGVPVFKSVSDMWNYQEILVALRPSLIVEFGTYAGGSALFFAHVARAAGLGVRVLSVDVDHSRVASEVRADPSIELLESSSVAPEALQRIAALRRERPGPAFFILDSDHAEAHVHAELTAIRALTAEGDVVIVEDTNVNGHPVLRAFGPGPYEALQRYLAEHPDDYRRDTQREAKFGFTFAFEGFMIRRRDAGGGRGESPGG